MLLAPNNLSPGMPWDTFQKAPHHMFRLGANVCSLIHYSQSQEARLLTPARTKLRKVIRPPGPGVIFFFAFNQFASFLLDILRGDSGFYSNSYTSFWS